MNTNFDMDVLKNQILAFDEKTYGPLSLLFLEDKLSKELQECENDSDKIEYLYFTLQKITAAISEAIFLKGFFKYSLQDVSIEIREIAFPKNTYIETYDYSDFDFIADELFDYQKNIEAKIGALKNQIKETIETPINNNKGETGLMVRKRKEKTTYITQNQSALLYEYFKRIKLFDCQQKEWAEAISIITSLTIKEQVFSEKYKSQKLSKDMEFLLEKLKEVVAEIQNEIPKRKAEEERMKN